MPPDTRLRARHRVLATTLTAVISLTALSAPADASTGYPATCVAGTFGRMFPGLPSASWSGAALTSLAAASMAEEETDPTPETEVDDEENPAIDAGYTYVGQFIDHDITSAGGDNDLLTPTNPASVTNRRTPALDLDSVYGAGPSRSPELYAADGFHLATGRLLSGSSDEGARDLPRDADGRAYLGDSRNDENRIIGGIASLTIRFHNKRADKVRLRHPLWSSARVLAETQRQVRNYYQWAVLTDFLPLIAGPATVSSVMPNLLSSRITGVNLHYYDPCREAMPVEFSVAAYRFGHTQVRALYRINETQADRVPVFTADFTDTTKNLSGFSPAPSSYGIDWKFFFTLGPTRTTNQPQLSYKLDNSLVYPLSQLPLPETGTGPANLAQRNLLRSQQFGLPSGQDVARAMGVAPLRDDQILIGKATGDADDTGDTESITAVDPGFAGKAPLWTYVFAESTALAYPVSGGKITGAQRAPMRLGPVGGRIVSETIIGLVWADRSSVLHDLSFFPDPTLTTFGRFGFKEFVRYATS